MKSIISIIVDTRQQRSFCSINEINRGDIIIYITRYKILEFSWLFGY